MNHRWASSSLGCVLLLMLVPLCASAAPKDPCKLLQRDLDQQIDDLKAWQRLDLQECYKISGSDSDACRQLNDQHAQDLRAFRDNRAFQMASCRGPLKAAAASPFAISNNDFYEKYHSNRGPCVEYPYVNCEQYDHYVHAKYHHHHHHYYADSSSGGRSVSAYVEKHGNAGKSAKSASGYVEKHENADKSAKQDAAPTHSSAHDTAAQPSRRGSDHDNYGNHSSTGGDSSPTASSNHSHDGSGTSHSGGSHASGGSSSSAGSSSSGASHSSGSGSGSSPGASSSSSASSGSSGASAASSASSASHGSGPK